MKKNAMIRCLKAGRAAFTDANNGSDKVEQSSSFLGRIGRGITRTRNFVLNTLFIVFLALVVLVLLNNCQSITVPSNSALIVNPKGAIVESATLPDPFQELLSAGPRIAQVELASILRAIEFAAADTDISMIVLDLDELVWAAPAHAQRIGEALRTFRESGKQVVSYGHFYSQAQYHIASFADALYMHPMGQIVLEGFGGFTFYFNELLENFDVNVHVYRVGSFKSAVEPLLRNDMSAEARMAAEALYQNIWQHLLKDVANNRLTTTEALQDYADNLGNALQTTQGDMARAALEAHLVDELLTVDQANVRLADDVGYRDAAAIEINGVDFQSYLLARNLIQPPMSIGKDKIAVIVAQGMIVNTGTDDQVVAADATIELIRQARADPAIKAVVLRVDSPGGSQLASELIRQELELLQVAGKPVIASFGASAASGGYWIAATADAIVAEPTTITGSIGIFSFLTTFEDTLARYGVYTDGVGTTSLTGSSVFSGISDAMGEVLQARVENGYEQFINLVARGRNMEAGAVEAVAQGRVWTGEVAADLGLVDELGGMQAALQKAAEIADLDGWTTVRLRHPVDPRAAFLAQLFAPQGQQSAAQWGLGSGLEQLVLMLNRFDDPNHAYVLCESCLAISPWRSR
jgi:protease IV